MLLAHSKVTAQGQISIPAEVRRRLGIGPGAVVEWDEAEGQITVRKAGRFTSSDIHQALFGETLPTQKSLDDLKKGVRDLMKTKHARD